MVPENLEELFQSCSDLYNSFQKNMVYYGNYNPGAFKTGRKIQQRIMSQFDIISHPDWGDPGMIQYYKIEKYSYYFIACFIKYGFRTYTNVINKHKKAVEKYNKENI